MEIKESKQAKLDAAVTALGALAQSHRLNVFRELVQAGQSGVAAGVLADRLNIPRSSLSFHLSTLKQGGLIAERREGRSIIYTAHFVAMHALIGFLLEDCCASDLRAIDADEASHAPFNSSNLIPFVKGEPL